MSNDSKDRYRALCESEAEIPLFLRDWWLDAVCGDDNWGVAIVCNGDRVDGCLPYSIRRRFGWVLIGQPPLTPFLGPWIRGMIVVAEDDYAKYFIGSGSNYHYSDVRGFPAQDLPEYGFSYV